MSLTQESLNLLSRSERVELLSILEERHRRNAKQDLVNYTKYIVVPGAPLTDNDDNELFYPDNVIPAEHHVLLLHTLHRVAKGEIKRLMIFMPPGSAKSTYASVVFPTWQMGINPGFNLIHTTYGSDLAKKFGRKCRSICKSKEFNHLFDTKLQDGNTAADDWSLENGSTYMCGGVLSGVTGNRADGLIIDDPLKGREEADSATIRDKVWEEYKSSLRTRLKPKGWQIIIQTRWHEDDLSGRILPEGYNGESGLVTSRDGEKWYVLCLQAQAESNNDPLGRKPGEWLWPEWFTPEFWENERRVQGSRNWSALYQQRPSPEDGEYFKREWIRWYDTRPSSTTMRIYGASDYAVTEGGGDYTVHMVVGVDPNDDIYILDLWRGQTSSDVWIDELIRLIRRYKPLQWEEESGQILKSLDPFIIRRMREERVFCYRKQVGSASDKPTRAQAIRGRMAMGKVYFPRNETWAEPLINEMMKFPNGSNDDQVDTLSLIGRMLDSMVKGKETEKKKKVDVHAVPTFNQILKGNNRNPSNTRI